MAGRPRDKNLDRLILRGAEKGVRESGYEGFSIEGLARDLGIAKTTIYTRWPSRTALLDAVLAPRIATPPSGLPNRQLLLRMLADDMRLAASPEGHAVVQLVLAARRPGVSEARGVFDALQRRRADYRRVLTVLSRRADEDAVEVAVDLLVGAVWGRIIVATRASRISPDDLAATVLALIESV
jgi:AcrR family transcriptional regulator